jgi:hypothetical protein
MEHERSRVYRRRVEHAPQALAMPAPEPKWQVPRPADQEYHMTANRWLNSRPKFVIAFHIERDAAGNEIARKPQEMPLRDAEQVIRDFPSEWSMYSTSAAEPARPTEPSALDRLGNLEHEMKLLQERVTSMRHEIAGTGRGN